MKDLVFSSQYILLLLAVLQNILCCIYRMVNIYTIFFILLAKNNYILSHGQKFFVKIFITAALPLHNTTGYKQ